MYFRHSSLTHLHLVNILPSVVYSFLQYPPSVWLHQNKRKILTRNEINKQTGSSKKKSTINQKVPWVSYRLRNNCILVFKIWQWKLIEISFKTSLAWGSETLKYSDHGRKECAKNIWKGNLKKNNGYIKIGELWGWEQTGI